MPDLLRPRRSARNRSRSKLSISRHNTTRLPALAALLVVDVEMDLAVVEIAVEIVLQEAMVPVVAVAVETDLAVLHVVVVTVSEAHPVVLQEAETPSTPTTPMLSQAWEHKSHHTKTATTTIDHEHLKVI